MREVRRDSHQTNVKVIHFSNISKLFHMVCFLKYLFAMSPKVANCCELDGSKLQQSLAKSISRRVLSSVFPLFKHSILYIPYI